MNNCYALLGTNVAIRNAKTMVSKAIQSESSVLIVGESGTGKSDLAKFIHEESSFKTHTFLVIPCSSLQESNFEKEISQTENGTIFFQDIDKLTPRLQFVFIKSLQNFFHCKESNKNLRLISSATIDLEDYVRRGFFREDLYLIFAQITVYLPPIRERREDISAIVNYLIQKSNKLRQSKINSISSDAMKVLYKHSWSNNLYELNNLIERITMLKQSGNIELSDLPPRLRSLVTNNIDNFYNGAHSESKVIEYEKKIEASKSQRQDHYLKENDSEKTAIDQFVKKEIDLGNGIDFYRIVEAFENKLLQEALNRAQHNKNKAAQLLSMNRTTLVEKLRKRSIFSHLCSENSKNKYNSSFTVLDGLGSERKKFEGQTYMTITGD